MRIQIGRFDLHFSKKAAPQQPRSGSLPYNQSQSNISLHNAQAKYMAKAGYTSCSIVGACLRVIQYTFAEPSLFVYDSNNNLKKGSRIQQLLDHPNPYQSQSELMQLISTYLFLGGNAYIYLARGKNKLIKELYAYSDMHITPITTNDGGMVSYYNFRYPNGSNKRLELDEIIHLKLPFPDPENPKVALSPLVLLAREIEVDVELTRYLRAFVKNDARPGSIAIVDKEVAADGGLGDIQEWKQDFIEQFGGDNIGAPIVSVGITDLKRMGSELKDMETDVLRYFSESRICGVLGVPQELAYLMSGREHSTYNNMSTLKQDYTDSTLVPLWKVIQDKLTHGLAYQIEPESYIRFDLSQVEALRVKTMNEQKGRSDVIMDYQKAVQVGEILPEPARVGLVLAIGIDENTAKELIPDVEPPLTVSDTGVIQKEIVQ